jgi:hypothetical protein
MKNIKNHIAVFSLLLAAGACSNSNQASKEPKQTYELLAKTNWLLGNWENNSSEGQAIESWVKENDSTLSGVNYFIMGKDTVSSEKLALRQTGNQLLYIPTVKEQNNGEAVLFTMTSASSKELVFENPQHDYPSKIKYTQINSDSIVAEISGQLKGKENTQQFPMKRKS